MPVRAETENTGVFHPLPMLAGMGEGTGGKIFFFFFLSEIEGGRVGHDGMGYFDCSVKFL